MEPNTLKYVCLSKVSNEKKHFVYKIFIMMSKMCFLLDCYGMHKCILTIKLFIFLSGVHQLQKICCIKAI